MREQRGPTVIEMSSNRYNRPREAPADAAARPAKILSPVSDAPLKGLDAGRRDGETCPRPGTQIPGCGRRAHEMHVGTRRNARGEDK